MIINEFCVGAHRMQQAAACEPAYGARRALCSFMDNLDSPISEERRRYPCNI
jgi:hypothetical protein